MELEGAPARRVPILGRVVDVRAPELAAVLWAFATANPRHLAENVAAGRGPMPDAALRKRMERDLRF